MEIYRQDKTVYQATSYFDSIALVNENGTSVTLENGDKLIFTVKAHHSGDCIIKKVLTADDIFEGAYPINVTPEELDIPPNRYFYDISLQHSNGDIEKIVPLSNFDVMPSMTKKEVS